MKRKILYLLLLSIISSLLLINLISCSNKELNKIEVNNNSKNEYLVGSEIDINNMFLKLYFNDEEQEISLSKEMLSKTIIDEVGENIINVNYEYEKKMFNCQFTLIGYEVSNIEVIDFPIKTYNLNDAVDIGSSKIKLTFSNDQTQLIPLSIDMLSSKVVNEIDENNNAIINITFNYNDKEYTTKVTIKVRKIMNSEVIDLNKLEYFVGEELIFEGAKIKITFSDESIEYIDLTKEMLDKTLLDEVGLQEVKVETKYGTMDISTMFEVEVKNKDIITNINANLLSEGIYEQFSLFPLEDLEVVVEYTDRTETLSVSNETLTMSMLSISELNECGEIEIVVSYKENTAKFVVKVLDEFDYYDYIEEKNEKIAIEKIKNDLLEYIPVSTTEKLELPTMIDYRYRISWNTSNPNIISYNGMITQDEEDITVVLTATIKGQYLSDSLTWNVLVPGLGPVVLKDITGRKLIFAYLSNSNYLRIRESDYSKLDVINFCFASVVGNQISLSGLSHLQEVLSLRREAGIRIVLSIGGGGNGSLGFSPACLTAQSRTALVNSIMDAVKKYKFDGIDLDWEYPGYNGLTDSHPLVDKDNFTLLCGELRKALDDYKEGLLLTSAVIAGSSNVDSVLKFYDAPVLNKYFDYVHLMTYDLNDSGTVTHNSNLYPTSSRIYAASTSVDVYTRAGFDKEKLVIGAAFYGKIFNLKTSQVADLSVLTKQASSVSSITYSRVINEYRYKTGFVEVFDSKAGAYIITNGTIAISYEPIEAIKAKTTYMLEQDLAGIMFWDYGSDNKGDLLNAMYITIRLNN